MQSNWLQERASEVTRAQDTRGPAAEGRGVQRSTDRDGHWQRALDGAGVRRGSPRGPCQQYAKGFGTDQFLVPLLPGADFAWPSRTEARREHE